MDVRHTVSLERELDPSQSHRLRLVKWFLAITHYIILAFLFIAFAVLWAVALPNIIFTGRYPRGISDFNVGVLRWAWRISFYSCAAMGTDRYPPFSLKDSDYPARFDV